jgi:phosphate/phosphite/phosphonate ABC transporter binding protein
MIAMASDALTFGVLPSRLDADDSLARLCERLGRMLDRPVQALRASSYGELIDVVERGRAQIVWMSPLLAALAEDRVQLRPLLAASRNGQADYRAVLFTHERSPLRTIDDLRGVSVAWVDRSSGSGYLVPRLMIAAAGHDLDRLFADERFLGSHDEVLRAVSERRATVGATFADAAPLAPFGLERGPFRALLFSEPIPNDLIMAHGLLPLADAMGFAAALHSVATVGDESSLVADVFGAAAFEFTAGTHLRSIRSQVQRARRLGLLLQM